MTNPPRPALETRRENAAFPRPRGPSGTTRLVGLCFAASVPFEPVPLFGGRSITFFIGVAFAAFVLAGFAVGRVQGRMPKGSAWLMVTYLALICATTFSSLDPDRSIAMGTQLAIRFAFVAALVAVMSRHWRALLVSYVLGSGALAATLLLVGEVEYGGRVTLLDADQNALGLSMAVGFAFALALLGPARTVMTAILLACATISAIGVFQTGSRTGLGAIAVAVLLRVISARQWQRPVRTLGLLGGLLYGAYYAFENGLLTERAYRLLEGGQIEDVRADVAGAYLAHPDWMVWGVGLGSDAAFLAEETGLFVYAHNLYLGVWVQLGVLGLALLLLLFGVSFRNALRRETRDVFITAAGAAFLYSMTLPAQTYMVYWFVIAFGMTATESAEDGLGRDRGETGEPYPAR